MQEGTVRHKYITQAVPYIQNQYLKQKKIIKNKNENKKVCIFLF